MEEGSGSVRSDSSELGGSCSQPRMPSEPSSRWRVATVRTWPRSKSTSTHWSPNASPSPKPSPCVTVS